MSSLQDTPRAERLHIGLFGKRNSGKSALLNALTNQEVAVVSSVAGTTTDRETGQSAYRANTTGSRTNGHRPDCMYG